MKVTKVCLILLASLTLAAAPSYAQTDSSVSTNKPPTSVTKPKPKRVQGTIVSVDVDNKVITLNTKKEIKVTSKTRIYNDGAPGTFTDATVGSHVLAMEHEDADGNWVATTLRIGILKHRTPPAAATNSPPTTPAPPQ